MGVNLWGVSPLCVNPINVYKSLAQILAECKGGTVRDRLEEASGIAMSRRTETAYKAQSKAPRLPDSTALSSAVGVGLLARRQNHGERGDAARIVTLTGSTSSLLSSALRPTSTRYRPLSSSRVASLPPSTV